MDVMLWVCAGIALASALLALAFLPRRLTGTVPPPEPGDVAAPAGARQAQ
jgi:hypothetical protein